MELDKKKWIYLFLFTLFSCEKEVDINENEVKEIVIKSRFSLSAESIVPLQKMDIIKAKSFSIKDSNQINKIINGINNCSKINKNERDYYGIIYIIYKDNKIDSLEIFKNTILYNNNSYQWEKVSKQYTDSLIFDFYFKKR